MKLYDRMFYDLLEKIEWDEQKGLNIIRGNSEGQLVTALYNDDMTCLAINDSYLKFFCMSCRSQNHSLIITASKQEEQNIKEQIKSIAKRLMDKKVVNIGKKL